MHHSFQRHLNNVPRRVHTRHLRHVLRPVTQRAFQLSLCRHLLHLICQSHKPRAQVSRFTRAIDYSLDFMCVLRIRLLMCGTLSTPPHHRIFIYLIFMYHFIFFGLLYQPQHFVTTRSCFEFAEHHESVQIRAAFFA